MLYTWNKNKSKKQIEYLLSLTEGISSFEQKQIRDAIYVLKLIAEDNKRKEIKQNDNFLLRMEMYDSFGDIVELIGEATKSFINHGPEELEYMPHDHDEDEILELTEKFYANLDEKWYHLFQKIFKERKLNVNFSESVPSCIYVPYLNYFYINLRKTGTIEEIIEPTHEYAHAISTLINPNNEKSYYKSILIEVPSIFLELIACQKFKGISGNPQEYNIYQKNLYDTVGALSEDIDIDFKALNGTDSPCIGLPQRLCNIESDQINLKNKITYSISYLVAIELLYIYYDDPKEAFNILNKIIDMNDEDHLQEKLAGLDIIPGKCFERYSYSLHKKLIKKSD